MEIGMIGLGKMGSAMARRLARGKHRVVVYNRTVEKSYALENDEPGVVASGSLRDLISKLAAPRVVWTMLPSGEPTEKIVNDLLSILSRGDTIIDGSNSYYRDTIRRAEQVTSRGLNFLDVGTSGGVWGLTEGYSMMVGGEASILERVRPIIESLAPGRTRGWGWVGPSGAGHFVKMVHNGIEYGLMESYAEGFEIMHKKDEFKLDLKKIAEIWRHGSVVRSWLLDLAAAALSDDQNLENVRGWVEDSGEGKWTTEEAIDLNVPAPAIALSLMMRFSSRHEDRYANKLLAALRQQFGGHEVRLKGGRSGRVRKKRKKLGRR